MNRIHAKYCSAGWAWSEPSSFKADTSHAGLPGQYASTSSFWAEVRVGEPSSDSGIRGLSTNFAFLRGEALVFLPHQSILYSIFSWKPERLLTHWSCCYQIWHISNDPHFIFFSGLFTLPRTYCTLQVILLTANADYGPKAHVMLPKELRTPNNITCFVLSPEMQCGICFEQLMISSQITWTSSFP